MSIGDELRLIDEGKWERDPEDRELATAIQAMVVFHMMHKSPRPKLVDSILACIRGGGYRKQ